MSEISPRDEQRLGGVHPQLAIKVRKLLRAMRELDFPMFVASGLRSDVEQAKLYAQGRSQAGPIVTNADGVATLSKHQPQSDGWAHAVDLAFLHRDPWAESHPWHLYGLIAEALGLKWGGRFRSRPDRPHIELKESLA